MADGKFRLAEWREARQMSGTQLAAKAGFSPSYISQLETGKRRYTQDVLEALAVALDCTTAELLGAPPPKPAILQVSPWRHPEQAAGHYVRAWRKHRDLSLEDLAAQVGLSHANLSRIERGQVPYAQRTLERLAAALGTDPANLIIMPPSAEEGARFLMDLSPTRRAQLAEIAQILARTPTADDAAILEAAAESNRRTAKLDKERVARAQRRAADDGSKSATRVKRLLHFK